MKVFRENLYEHHSQVLTVERVLHQSWTGFQNVLIFQNALFGRVMALDGVVQLTERDNHIYHEMLVHVPMMAHGCPRDVLIIGGGDGGVLKEVLRHPVYRAVLVELDKEVVRLSRRFFSSVSSGAFDNRRAEVIIDDGIHFAATSDRTFDILIIDSTDPVGPGERLFTPSFYDDCRRLVRPGGIMTIQSGAPFYFPDQLDTACARIRSAAFDVALPYLAPVPSYAGGMLALVAAGDSPRSVCPDIATIEDRFRRGCFDLSYYSPQVHEAAFTLPPSFSRPHRDATFGKFCDSLGAHASSKKEWKLGPRSAGPIND